MIQLGIEHEMFLVYKNGDPISYDIVQKFWSILQKQIPTSTLVKNFDQTAIVGVDISPYGDLSNDTLGSCIEYASCVCDTIFSVKENHSQAVDLILKSLKIYNESIVDTEEHIYLHSIGKHPTVIASENSYMSLRTPKGPVYDYINNIRKWNHKIYLPTTSLQVSVDLPAGKEYETISSLHRVMPLVIAMTTNASFSGGVKTPYQSQRLVDQESFIPDNHIDKHLLGMWRQEPHSMEDILDSVFRNRPMIGISKDKRSSIEVVVVDGVTPTLYDYICQNGGDPMLLVNPMQRLAFAHTKIQMNPPKNLELQREETIKAIENKNVFAFLQSKGVKFYTEIRCIDSPLPGDEMFSPSLILGLVSNYKDLEAFAKQKEYKEWLSYDEVARKMGYKDTTLRNLSDNLFVIAHTGLKNRLLGEEKALETYKKKYLDHLLVPSMRYESFDDLLVQSRYAFY